MLHEHDAQMSADHSESLITSAPTSAEGQFNLEDLRLSQDFTTNVGVKKLVTTVPTRKPHRQEFVRVHPDPAYRLETAAL